MGIYWLFFLMLMLFYIYQMRKDTFDRDSWNIIYGLFFLGFLGWILF